MKRIIVAFFIFSVILGLAAGTWAKKPITLKAVQFVNLGNPGEAGFHLLVDMINKASKGELVIKIVGGPEATPGRQQPEAVRTGAIDISFVASSWYKSMVRVSPLIKMSLLKPWEERKSGFFDFLVKEHEKQGLRYIGNAHVYGPFYLYSKVPVKDISGLKGKRFRHSPAYPFFQTFGIKPVTASHSEIYPGLERNVFDGLAINHTNFINLRLYEVCKYVVGPGFYAHGAAAVIMNLAKFNKLPKHLQKVITDSMEKAEPQIIEKNDAIQVDNWKILKAKGVKHVKWSDEESKIFLDKVNQAMWDKEGKKLKPEKLEKMRKMMGY
ncbi:MAG: TRAP transporter substrate-binding protein DctP [Deltaproteobacteria bacterium]|nr:TRAP transporter substrate-binding protein DctP [Deltaproteobacteria bacterium]